jgi:hypothetical protein
VGDIPPPLKSNYMANAKTAPVKKEETKVKVELGETIEEVVEGSNEHLVLSQEYDPGKKYMFELATHNPERDSPVWIMQGQKTFAAPIKKFKPWHNLVLTSQIVWKGNRRMIRYYDGCTTIFVDKQPKEREMIDSLIAQTNKNRFILIDGKVGFYGDDRMALLYLNICSWNAESLFRTRTSDAIFMSVNADKIATAESAKLDKTETALEMARTATGTRMLIHAAYLGIPTMDWDSGNERTEGEIRTDYRKEALRDSEHFISSYGNKAIEIRYYIDKALEKGTITNRLNPNKVCWNSSGREILDTSGLKSNEAIGQKLFEFSQTSEGEEFVLQLRAINE